MKHYFYLFLFAILCYSCDSDSTDVMEDSSGELLIKQIKFISEYPEDDEVITYNYNGNRLVDRRRMDGSIMDEYMYENDKLSRINFYEEDEPNVVRAFTTFTYDGDGKLVEYVVHSINQFGNVFAVKSVLTNNADGTQIGRQQFTGNLQMQTNSTFTSTYNFENGNLKNEDYDNADFDVDYFYDAQNGIHKNIEFVNILNILDLNYGALESGQNNLLRKESQTGLPTSLFLESYTYTYNAQGYPETGEFLEAGEVVYDLEFTYVNAQ